MIKVILVDDNELVREGIKFLLEQSGGFEVVGEAQNGKDALDLINTRDSDVIITDYNMPVMDGLALIRTLMRQGISIPIIIMSGLDDKIYVNTLFKEGVSGLLHKNITSEELIFAVGHVVSGKRYLHSDIALEMALK